jgi:hypothetical protein
VEKLLKIRGRAVHVLSPGTFFLSRRAQTVVIAFGWCSFASSFACAAPGGD